MQRVFSPISVPIGETLTISESEFHHITKVLRLGCGDSLEIFDGQGKVAEGKIDKVSKRECLVKIENITQEQQRHRVSVAFALPKGQALDFILHRCTEIGTKAFIPLLTEHSFQAGNWNEERWQKVLIEVCKQCQSSFLPDLMKPQRLSEWLKNRSKERLLFFCDEANRDAAPPFIKDEQHIDLLIGPEGGWSDEEREVVLGSGAVSFSLGSQRLRAETAALVALVLSKQLVREI